MSKEKAKEETITKECKKCKDKKENKEPKEEFIKLTKEEVEAMNKKINDSEEKALRASAELINYRKRKDEETEKILKYCNEDLVLEILPILDNFDRAMNIGNKEISDELNQYLNGMKMIQKGLIAALLKFEVKEIDSLDKKFDPKYHQAVMKESDPNKEKEIILEVYQKGYMLKDKVIRPAMVKVND